ncbi:MAG: RDD family protein [Saprospiraceae bacterium]
MNKSAPKESSVIEPQYFALKATITDRLKSSIIDTVVLAGLFYATSLLLDSFNIESTNIRITILILILLYEPIMVSLGQTIGQRVMKLRVVDKSAMIHGDKTERSVNILKSLIRYLLKLTLGWVSLITIWPDVYGRAIHDRAISSIMISK